MEEKETGAMIRTSSGYPMSSLESGSKRSDKINPLSPISPRNSPRNSPDHGRLHDRDDSIQRKRFEHKIQLENLELENNYHSCCLGNTDKRLLEYISKNVVIIASLLFSMSMLIFDAINKNECNPLQSVYTSIIMLIIGLYINPDPDSKS